jgi:NitT/TauT family transport system substrate-binding protein
VRGGAELSKQSTKKNWYFFGIIVFVLAPLVLWASFKWQKKESRVYKIGLINWPGFYPAVLADKLGLYEKNGVHVKLMIAADNPEMNNKFQTGVSDMAYGVFADYVLMQGREIPIKFIQVTDYSRSDVIIGDSKIKSLTDLKGKTIGIGDINSFSEYFVLTLLKKVGMNENDVKFKLVNYFDVTKSLEKNEIQAGHTWEPETSKALNKGYRIIESSDSVKGSVTDGLAARADALTSESDIIHILKAFYEAQKLLLEKPEIYAPIIAEVFKEEIPMILKIINTGAYYLNIEDCRKSFEGQSESLASLTYATKLISDFFHNRGQLGSKVLPKEILAPEYIYKLSEIENTKKRVTGK